MNFILLLSCFSKSLTTKHYKPMTPCVDAIILRLDKECDQTYYYQEYDSFWIQAEGESIICGPIYLFMPQPFKMDLTMLYESNGFELCTDPMYTVYSFPETEDEE